ncbi:hypothetical protein D9623_23160 [Azospirillum brasilense]|uniref:Uncharacterized protein n=1 Tax=Azospirillum brasilense TaxID=192 RepID=A0A0P0FB23_AZOBR|nr:MULTISPECIES: hypothetical protein [Azospirillum]ALJ38152.1 hypothetical protein AMK58_21740 [Azospirillum brasilense]MDW7556131.1 hypothetical protein [Azospirillum brasilense]MDW7596101.1 hypothetical protein [Azospirillum brasilense]MDW7631021.1 hypothetical protein [Azospirillum brasilense]MDX5955195.1 hypothetical protein [Azospirillum brasilense]
MPTMNSGPPEALCRLHREKAVEREKLGKLRRAILVGADDCKNGRLDDRPIADILNDIND